MRGEVHMPQLGLDVHVGGVCRGVEQIVVNCRFVDWLGPGAEVQVPDMCFITRSATVAVDFFDDEPGVLVC